MYQLETYRQAFLDYLETQDFSKEPLNLYEPVGYIMGLGGKRMRPILTLMACDLFSKDFKKALPAAMAVEVFHNFSLVHDDIMDDAPLRRGKKTVHEKWDVNTGILSGDAMLINAYQFLETYEGEKLGSLFQLFSKTAIEVCEGQQYDVDFEERNDVSIEEYLKMIEFKTSVLVAAALKMGAIVADADAENQNLIYEFGRNLGIAFQLQDDYLDAFGDPESFGKQVGGDIIENKKTFLYLKAMELGDLDAQKTLNDLFSIQPKDATSKVALVKDIFQLSGATEAILNEVKKYTDFAFDALSKIEASSESKTVFRVFGEQLMNRTA
ncbi:polyprenyl synthetase family protein [Croceivirga thetidis]|uniref:Polyprenyl synthetase family protein n=1 Tax=Croceivirga thetidis TaxID=2721623 RepID=A0ABX1GPH5_9FLAO|nr:polyprenyl synthetase family protein [Croceivirga thetidis]NKI30970.1 polyprenyl synthetase family protein [Croceivirga thetidis]